MKLLDILQLSEEELTKMIDEEIKVNTNDPSINFNKEDVAYFEVNELKYKCEFTRSISENGKTILDFKFKLTNNPKFPKRKNFSTEEQYQIALQKSQIGVTGTGKPFSIFSKVVSALRVYLNKNKIDYISFSGDEDHKNLYSILVKRLNQYFPEYSKLDKNPFTNEILDEGEFWLEKTK